MSRYYFHSITADGIFADNVGVEVEDASLRYEAIRAIFELSVEFSPIAEDLWVLGFRVVDDGGRTVLELPLRDMTHALQ